MSANFWFATAKIQLYFELHNRQTRFSYIFITKITRFSYKIACIFTRFSHFMPNKYFSTTTHR